MLGAISSQPLGCMALPAALPAPPPAPTGRAGITDTYFAQVPAGGQRLPCPRPCICPLPWAAAARFVGDGMWKHQSVRHLQGVTWRGWEGDRGRAALVHGGDPAPEPGLSQGDCKNSQLCPHVPKHRPPDNFFFSQERFHPFIPSFICSTKSYLGATRGEGSRGEEGEQIPHGLSQPGDIGAVLVTILQREGQVPLGSGSLAGVRALFSVSSCHPTVSSPAR